MKQPGKLKRWLLRRLGGVPRSEYNIVCEQRDTFIGDLGINDRLIKSLEAENERLTERLQRVLLSIDTVKEMNKEQQIKQMMLDVPQNIVAYDGNPAGQHLYGEQRQEIAEAFYNAGYRKTFTSDLWRVMKEIKEVSNE